MYESSELLASFLCSALNGNAQKGPEFAADCHLMHGDALFGREDYRGALVKEQHRVVFVFWCYTYVFLIRKRTKRLKNASALMRKTRAGCDHLGGTPAIQSQPARWRCELLAV